MYSVVLFDFDGVIVDSNQIRLDGFTTLYSTINPIEMINYKKFLVNSHGLSRYEKIEFLYKNILKKSVDWEKICIDAKLYSDIVKTRVINAPEIHGFRSFIKKNYNKASYALISSSDEHELREICRERKIDKFFSNILGSPNRKVDNIKMFLDEYNIKKTDAIYIGDSKHDEIAAHNSGIQFIGFGDKKEFDSSVKIVKSYTELEKLLF